MSQHITVLLNEAVEALAIKPNGIYVDATFGRGGHSRLILSHLSDSGRLIAIDRDLRAIEDAKKIDDDRFQIIHDQFSNLEAIVKSLGLTGKVDGVLMDLGVSSPQLDEAERGFSFMKDGPLDMRMDITKGISASDWLYQASEEDIAWVLKHFGEERYAKRIARYIVEANSEKKIETTHELAELVKRASPTKDKNKHPATRVFQAIRIYINSELQEVETALNSMDSILNHQGRIAVISFHSLEDRIVKTYIKGVSEGAKVPKGLPLTEKQIQEMKQVTFISKGKKKPSKDEVDFNPRSRSAILRIAEKI